VIEDKNVGRLYILVGHSSQVQFEDAGCDMVQGPQLPSQFNWSDLLQRRHVTSNVAMFCHFKDEIRHAPENSSWNDCFSRVEPTDYSGHVGAFRHYRSFVHKRFREELKAACDVRRLLHDCSNVERL
jgi:hypothetical protein